MREAWTLLCCQPKAGLSDCLHPQSQGPGAIWPSPEGVLPPCLPPHTSLGKGRSQGTCCCLPSRVQPKQRPNPCACSFSLAAHLLCWQSSLWPRKTHLSSFSLGDVGVLSSPGETAFCWSDSLCVPCGQHLLSLVVSGQASCLWELLPFLPGLQLMLKSGIWAEQNGLCSTELMGPAYMQPPETTPTAKVSASERIRVGPPPCCLLQAGLLTLCTLCPGGIVGGNNFRAP